MHRRDVRGKEQRVQLVKTTSLEVRGFIDVAIRQNTASPQMVPLGWSITVVTAAAPGDASRQFRECNNNTEHRKRVHLVQCTEVGSCQARILPTHHRAPFRPPLVAACPAQEGNRYRVLLIHLVSSCYNFTVRTCVNVCVHRCVSWSPPLPCS